MRHQVYCVHSQRGWGSSGRPASHNMDVSSRCVGSLLGMAVCDAVGTTVEFMPPGSFSPVDVHGWRREVLSPGGTSAFIHQCKHKVYS